MTKERGDVLFECAASSMVNKLYGGDRKIGEVYVDIFAEEMWGTTPTPHAWQVGFLCVCGRRGQPCMNWYLGPNEFHVCCFSTYQFSGPRALEEMAVDRWVCMRKQHFLEGRRWRSLEWMGSRAPTTLNFRYFLLVPSTRGSVAVGNGGEKIQAGREGCEKCCSAEFCGGSTWMLA